MGMPDRVSRSAAASWAVSARGLRSPRRRPTRRRRRAARSEGPSSRSANPADIAAVTTNTRAASTRVGGVRALAQRGRERPVRVGLGTGERSQRRRPAPAGIADPHARVDGAVDHERAALARLDEAVQSDAAARTW